LKRKSTLSRYSYLVAQKLHRTLSENALSTVDDEAKPLEALEKLALMHQMFRLRTAGDEDIVPVHEGEVQACQHPVHHSLERVPRVPETKREAGKPERHCDRRFLCVGRMHQYLIITFLKINFTENCASCHPSSEVQHV
jgi:hypothetical protein